MFDEILADELWIDRFDESPTNHLQSPGEESSAIKFKSDEFALTIWREFCEPNSIIKAIQSIPTKIHIAWNCGTTKNSKRIAIFHFSFLILNSDNEGLIHCETNIGRNKLIVIGDKSNDAFFTISPYYFRKFTRTKMPIWICKISKWVNLLISIILYRNCSKQNIVLGSKHFPIPMI